MRRNGWVSKVNEDFLVVFQYSSSTRVLWKARALGRNFIYSLDTRSNAILGTRTRSILELLLLVTPLLQSAFFPLRMRRLSNHQRVRWGKRANAHCGDSQSFLDKRIRSDYDKEMLSNPQVNFHKLVDMNCLTILDSNVMSIRIPMNEERFTLFIAFINFEW